MSHHSPDTGDQLRYTLLAQSPDGVTLALGRDDGEIEIITPGSGESPPHASLTIRDPVSIRKGPEWVIHGEQADRIIPVRSYSDPRVGEWQSGFDAEEQTWCIVRP